MENEKNIAVINKMRNQGSIYDYLVQQIGMRSSQKYIMSQQLSDFRRNGSLLESKLNDFCQAINPFENRFINNEMLEKLLEDDEFAVKLQTGPQYLFCEIDTSTYQVLLSRNSKKCSYAFNSKLNTLKIFYNYDILSGQKTLSISDLNNLENNILNWNVTNSIFQPLKFTKFWEVAIRSIDEAIIITNDFYQEKLGNGENLKLAKTK